MASQPVACIRWNLWNRIANNPLKGFCHNAIGAIPSTGKYRRKPETTGALLLCSGHWPCETRT